VTTQTREFAVFVASPSDVPDEREAVRRAANKVNDTLGRRFGLRLNVEGWEQVQPALGRPQSIINPLIDECDVFVGLLHRRWGTPTGTHTSGFEEEFERALARHEGNRPLRVGLFFRQISSDQLADPGPELTRVLSFQSRIREEHTALYKSFVDVGDLELALQTFFTDFLSEAAATDARPPQGAESTASSKSVEAAAVNDEPVDEARTELGQNLEAWADLVRAREPKSVASVDRLLAFALAASNDGELLPARVTNRLYRKREELHLSIAEADVWLRTLCADTGQSSRDGWGRVIPGWYFYRDGGERVWDYLADIAANEDSLCAQGAVSMLRRFGARPAVLWCATILDNAATDGGRLTGPTSAGSSPQPLGTLATAAARWLGLFQSDSTRHGAVDYLYETATAGDTSLLDELADSVADALWGTEVFAAIATIKGDSTAAVDFVLTQAYSVSDWAAAATAKVIPSLVPEQLVALIESRHRREELRRSAFDRLFDLPAIDPLHGQAAFSAMLRRSEESRDHVLDRMVTNGTDERRAWLRAAWDALPEDERKPNLEDRIAASVTSPDELFERLGRGWLSLHAWTALSFQHSPQLAERAREVMRTDGDEFVDEIAVAANPEAKRIEEFSRGRGREGALRILASLPPADRQQGDVELVRQELARADWVTQRQAVLTLAALAERQDVPALLDGAMKAAVRMTDNRGVLQTICDVGGRSAADSLVQHDDEDVAAAGAAAIATDSNTSDHELVDLLYHRFGKVRRSATEALVARLDRDHLEVLLDEYPTRPGHYYYNVIAHLDLHLYSPGIGR
jgi:Domain of unknown function (DUF4062)